MRDKPLFISSVSVLVIYSFFLLVIFTPLKSVFYPFITSAVVVYLLLPVVHLLERFRVKSHIAAFIVYALILSLGAFIVLYAFPRIYTALGKIRDLISLYIGGEIGEKIQSSIFQGGAERLYTAAVSATRGAINIIVSFASAFYILCDMKSVKNAVKELVPVKLIPSFRILCDDVKSSLDAFFKGQLLIALILFVIDGIFLYFVKIPYSWALAFIAALLDIIPYAGACVAMGIIILVTVISAPDKILIVVIGLIIIQQIENNVITPKISSETLSIHPAVTVLALYVGAFGGFWGILLAIPLVCIGKRIFLRIVQSII